MIKSVYAYIVPHCEDVDETFGYSIDEPIDIDGVPSKVIVVKIADEYDSNLQTIAINKIKSMDTSSYTIIGSGDTGWTLIDSPLDTGLVAPMIKWNTSGINQSFNIIHAAIQM